MNRELKKAVTRIRKAQDAVFNHKIADCNCIDICVHTLVKENGKSDKFFSVFLHTNNGVKQYTIDNQPAWQLEQKLADMSNFIGYPV